MSRQHIQQRASRVTRFLVVQLIALVGWIIVQSFFSLSLIGRAIPFSVTIVIEAIWWIITLVIMFLFFMREYKSFVQVAVDLEDANKRLREATNRILHELKNQNEQGEQESPGQTEPLNHSNQAAHTPSDQTEHDSPDQGEQAVHELSDQTEQASPAHGQQVEPEPSSPGDQAEQGSKAE